MDVSKNLQKQKFHVFDGQKMQPDLVGMLPGNLKSWTRQAKRSQNAEETKHLWC